MTDAFTLHDRDVLVSSWLDVLGNKGNDMAAAGSMLMVEERCAEACGSQVHTQDWGLLGRLAGVATDQRHSYPGLPVGRRGLPALGLPDGRGAT